MKCRPVRLHTGVSKSVAPASFYVADLGRFLFYMRSCGGRFIEHVYGMSKIERLGDGSN